MQASTYNQRMTAMTIHRSYVSLWSSGAPCVDTLIVFYPAVHLSMHDFCMQATSVELCS